MHALHVVTVNAHSHSFSFLELVLFEQSTDHENGIDTHLLVSEAKIALGFNRQLGESDGQTRSQVVVLSVDKSVAKREICALILSLGCCRCAGSFVLNDDGLGTIASVRKHNCLRDDLRTGIFDFFIFFLFASSRWVFRLGVDRERADVAFD